MILPAANIDDGHLAVKMDLLAGRHRAVHVLSVRTLGLDEIWDGFTLSTLRKRIAGFNAEHDVEARKDVLFVSENRGPHRCAWNSFDKDLIALAVFSLSDLRGVEIDQRILPAKA